MAIGADLDRHSDEKEDVEEWSQYKTPAAPVHEGEEEAAFAVDHHTNSLDYNVRSGSLADHFQVSAGKSKAVDFDFFSNVDSCLYSKIVADMLRIISIATKRVDVVVGSVVNSSSSAASAVNV